MRRVGVLMTFVAADDPAGHTRLLAFAQALAQLGWTDGRNIRIELRWGAGEPERIRRYAAELVALAPDCHPDGGHWKHGAAAAGNSCCAGPRAPSPGSELAPWGRVLSE
jgi:hypothetical protein